MKIIKAYLNRNEISRINWVIAKLKSLEKGKSILDAGAGEMRYRPYCTHLVYTSQDFCQYDGKGNNQGLQTQTWNTAQIDIVSDLTKIPVQSSPFDAILCTEVLEHVPDPIKAIEEFSRILKKDGTLILTAPFASLTHFAPYHFYSGFNSYFYKENLEKNGFQLVEITSNGTYLDFLEQEHLRMLTSYIKSFSLVAACVSALGWVSVKVLSWFKASAKFKTAETLCFGYQIVAKRV